MSALKVVPASSPYNAQLARLSKIEGVVRASENDGLLARWEFGKELVDLREGKQLPKGLLEEIGEKFDLGHSEIQKRMLFATTFPTRKEVSDAVTHFPTWREMTHTGLVQKPKPKSKPKTAGEEEVTALKPKKGKVPTQALHTCALAFPKVSAQSFTEKELQDADILYGEITRIYEELNELGMNPRKEQ